MEKCLLKKMSEKCEEEKCEEEKSTLKIIVKSVAEEEGFFEKPTHVHANIRQVLIPHYDNWAKECIVEGTYSHYRTDHPMSPDGWAMMNIPFCLSVFYDDIWGARFFISMEEEKP
jgi:hypothetical protein